jgi:hypothetical protein
MKNKNVLTGYLEHSITFPPTYKFDLNSDEYDSSKKARTPSWTDRILFKNNSELAWECLHYSSVAPIKSSDHRPVHAIFNSVRFAAPHQQKKKSFSFHNNQMQAFAHETSHLPKAGSDLKSSATCTLQ